MRSIFLIPLFCMSIITSPLSAKEIIITADDYPPWKIAENEKIVGGIDTHLVTALLDGFDLTPHYKLAPWMRCLALLENGKGDLVSGITMTEDRTEYLTYLHPPYKTKSEKVLLVHSGSKNTINTLKDMENRTIGVLRGAKYFDGFDDNRAIIKFETDTDLMGIRMIAAGRLDGFMITKENAQYLLNQNSHLKENIEISTWRHDKKVDVYFAVSNKSNLLQRIDKLEARLKYLVETGEIDRIINEYLLSQTQPG